MPPPIQSSPRKQYSNLNILQTVRIPLTPIKNLTTVGGLPKFETGQELARQYMKAGGAMHKKEESQLLHHVMEISKKEVKTTAKKVTDVITLEDTEDSDESDSIKVDGARGHGLDFERPWHSAPKG